MSDKNFKNDAMLAEYSAANDAYMHYDNFSWQVGSILIAGAFVFWGFLTNVSSEPSLLYAGSILVSFLMSTWILYCDHNRQIYKCKLSRIQEIEKVFGMKQHSGWLRTSQDQSPKYRTYGLSGYILNYIVYLVASLGAPIITYLKGYSSVVLLIPLVFVLITLVWTFINQWKLKKHLS